MKKTTSKTTASNTVDLPEATSSECTDCVISELELDTGRADLNTLVGKLNEVIKHINGN